MKKRTERISREAFSSLSHPTTTQHSPFVTIRRFQKNNNKGGTAFLVTISKKEVPTAVKRNLLRRRYTNIIRLCVLPGGTKDIFQFIVKKKALTAPFEELVSDSKSLLRGLHT